MRRKRPRRTSENRHKKRWRLFTAGSACHSEPVLRVRQGDPTPPRRSTRRVDMMALLWNPEYALWKHRRLGSCLSDCFQYMRAEPSYSIHRRAVCGRWSSTPDVQREPTAVEEVPAIDSTGEIGINSEECRRVTQSPSSPERKATSRDVRAATFEDFVPQAKPSVPGRGKQGWLTLLSSGHTTSLVTSPSAPPLCATHFEC